jgi:hypothetical protein
MTEHQHATPDRDDPLSIERWWPHLSIEAKHAVLEDARRPLPPEVLNEIEAITGHRPDRDRLDEHERDFVRTQGEPVD